MAAKTEQKHNLNEPKTSALSFSEADAARLLDALTQALESNDQRRFLKLFDASRMPNYAVFRDQVAAFFDKYEAFRARYHITRASIEGEVGVVLADFELEKTPSGTEVPTVRKNAQLRLVTSWDGKQWKIIDLAPLAIFS